MEPNNLSVMPLLSAGGLALRLVIFVDSFYCEYASNCKSWWVSLTLLTCVRLRLVRFLVFRCGGVLLVCRSVSSIGFGPLCLLQVRVLAVFSSLPDFSPILNSPYVLLISSSSLLACLLFHKLLWSISVLV